MIRKILLLATVILSVLLTGCNGASHEPLSIATNQWPGYEPLYLARGLDYFSRDEIRLVELPSASKVIQAYRAGAVHAAALTLDETLLLLQDHVPARILLVMDVSNGADVVMARPGVETLADLKGKRIGVESFALGAYMLARALEVGKLDPSDVVIVPLTVDQHEEAYLSGKVDALVTFEPVRTKLTQAGAHVLFDSSRIPNEIFDVLVINPQYMQKNPRQVARIKSAWFRALDFMRLHPDDAARRMAQRQAITPEEFLASLKELEIPDRDENIRLLEGSAPAILPPARRLAKVMRDDWLLHDTVDPAALLDRR
jgi:NitT/TauT family transport system substrate-binding protein